MRIGIYGGTFDPVHVGHLILAEQAREQGRLDQVWFVPAAQQPLRPNAVTPFAQRVEMLGLAIAGNPAFRVDEIEKELPLPSYTARMLAALRLRHPSPENEFYFVLGGDSLESLPTWHDPQGIVAQAGLLVMERRGSRRVSPDELRQALNLPADAPLSLEFVENASLIDVSSTDLRQRLREGRTVRYLLPAAVEVYAREKGLYRAF
jgi:nicotinate-nucleotide adenylyltransferase